ncbi:hypothetical protein ACPCAB_12545 [Streptomyces koyangensis]|uniref:hypothetical protein n=1 Tax=Streptomyces TaxID=1883 RepID=UPI00102264CB|nr:hypothetical protein [Streptomyces sp. SCA2-2]RZE98552.1 hypothetical protein C0L86_15935 [Streptomyces sp. SCA2-2]
MSSFNEVANLRATEVQVLTEAKKTLGAVYLVGYVVECRLKHFLQLNGIPFPRSGREGHNLRGLWQSTGFTKPYGHPSLFIEHWDTELRYRIALPAGVDAEDLLQGGQQLAGWVATRIRQSGSRAGSRRRRQR